MKRRAIIPAAGLGTRLRHLSSGEPKELLPVGGVPMLFHALRELEAAGIEEVAVITSPRKPAIEEVLTGRQTMEGAKRSEIERLRAAFYFRFFLQHQPLGLAHAILQASDWLGTEPFVLALPDGIFLPAGSSVSALVAAWEERPCDLLAITRVDARDAPLLGNCGLVEVEEEPGPGRPVRVRKLHDKRPGELRLDAPTALRAFPRDILGPRFLAAAEAECRRRRPDEEIDDVPILQEMIEEGGVYGLLLEGTGFDAGHPRGLEAAERALRGG